MKKITFDNKEYFIEYDNLKTEYETSFYNIEKNLYKDENLKAIKKELNAFIEKKLNLRYCDTSLYDISFIMDTDTFDNEPEYFLNIDSPNFKAQIKLNDANIKTINSKKENLTKIIELKKYIESANKQIKYFEDNINVIKNNIEIKKNEIEKINKEIKDLENEN